jgi:hypothetical protein
MVGEKTNVLSGRVLLCILFAFYVMCLAAMGAAKGVFSSITA